MKISDCLESLLSQVPANTDQQYILYMLWKQSNQLLWASDDTYLPLIDVKSSKISLVYQDDELDGLSYIITDHEEILFFLQYLLQSGKTMYMRYTPDVVRIPKEILIEKINKALDENNENEFLTLTKQLKEWYI